MKEKIRNFIAECEKQEGGHFQGIDQLMCDYWKKLDYTKGVPYVEMLNRIVSAFRDGEDELLAGDLELLREYYQECRKEYYRLLDEARAYVENTPMVEPIRERFISLLESCYVYTIASDTAKQEHLPLQDGADMVGLLAIAMLNTLGVEYIATTKEREGRAYGTSR